jgi:hypothetical protein
MDAGAEAQEALAKSEVPAAPEASGFAPEGSSAFAPEKTEELRRDELGSAPSSSPDSDDDLQ